MVTVHVPGRYFNFQLRQSSFDPQRLVLESAHLASRSQLHRSPEKAILDRPATVQQSLEPALDC